MNYHDFPGCPKPVNRIRTHLRNLGMSVCAVAVTTVIIFAMMYMAGHF